MEQVLTIVAADAVPDAIMQRLRVLLPNAREMWLAEVRAVDMFFEQNAAGRIRSLLEGMAVDYAIQEVAHRRKKLLISDMDSTIIGQECIDEIAALAGVKAEVSAITERAMQGELDFSASLMARVALLKGLPASLLQQVWENVITLNAGARCLVQTMRAHGAYTMLVSGGFSFFSEKVADASGFNAHFANELLVADGVLTGEVRSPILHKAAKKELLLHAVAERSIEIQDTVAIGDGANDAAMIEAAGLGVAYYAKPTLRALADASIAHTDLTTLLYFQGYRQEEFV
jgi:phosphoserine phosphatase